MNHFDKSASTWDNNPVRIELTGIVANELKKNIHLNKKMKAMDYGCETGFSSICYQFSKESKDQKIIKYPIFLMIAKKV
ncbi:MAG: hypothetical protein Q8880_10195 [Bacteroidota bacterium]|nr:hypothetical protein [Bacteroidota bacterium]